MANVRQNTFDKLVAGLDADDRKALAEKLKHISANSPIPEFDKKEESSSNVVLLSQKLKNESMIYYLILCLRSFFSHKKIDTIYNDDMVSAIARKLNSVSPEIVDYQKKLLNQPFHDHLKEMMDCAEFFKPYVSLANDHPGEFYVFLSAFLVPEISAEIKKEVDPYTIPFNRDVTSDLRLSKLRNLENVLRSISPDLRALLYDSVKRVEWLFQFSTLPFVHFISQFTTVGSNTYTCPFDAARADFPSFAKVLNAATAVNTETMEALFLFYQKKNMQTLDRSSGEMERQLVNFVSDSAIKFSKIKSLISSVSFSNLGKVVFHSFDWYCEKFGGAEDWFQKFHDEWKHIFEEQWNSWLKDRKKSQLSMVLNSHFGIKEFPEMPYRPWASIWDGLSFNGELTGGFLVWFSKNKLREAIDILNVLVLEGTFIITDNRTEISNIVASFGNLIEQLRKFSDSFSPSGKYGSVFDKYINGNSLRTMHAQGQIDSMILAGETQLSEMNKKFCENCRTIEKILSVIIDDKKITGYAGLQNYRAIKGHENTEYREKLLGTRSLLYNAYSLLVEVEPLDLPRYSARIK